MKKTLATIGTVLTLAGGGFVADEVINPYETVDTKLEIQAEAIVPEMGEQKIVVETTKPKVTFEKWDGEVSLGVTYTGIAPTTEGARKFLSEKVEWTDGAQTMEVVPLAPTEQFEDGGMEINVVLASEPATNVFTFQLDNWQNLDFTYQELSKEQEVKGYYQPDNVKGSYAVYYTNHKDHIEGERNYATGKAYHIYRPLVTDSGGQTVWATLSYSAGVLSVTVPQDFLAQAVYPVTIDPTFGYTTCGATQTGGASSNINYEETLSPTGTNTLTNISLCMTPSSSSGTFKYGLYSVTGTAPNARLVVDASNVTTGSTAKQFYINTVSYNYALTANTAYYFATIQSGGEFWFDTDVAADDLYFEGGSAFPATAAGASYDSTFNWSVYGTYSTGGGATPNSPTVNVQSQINIGGGQIIIQ